MIRGETPFSKRQIQRICSRNFGIGADGAFFLAPSEDVDFEIEAFNADGTRIRFCANGTRCAVLFAREQGWFHGSSTRFKAGDGVHLAEVDGDEVLLGMSSVKHSQKKKGGYVLDTGSVHYVRFEKDIEKIDVEKRGFQYRHDKTISPSGANVNFVQVKGGRRLSLRTFEKGVEGEVFACGTGVVASVLVFAERKNLNDGVVRVSTRGGILEVGYGRSPQGFHGITLKGQAKKVFTGVWDGSD